GRLGTRSPSKYGTTTGARASSPAPTSGAASASASSPAASTPKSRAPASVTFVAFNVHTNGRKQPVASAKDATAPVASAVGASLTAKTVPDVPIDTTTSPAPRPTPSAAAMLSPVPAATIASLPNAVVTPARAPGPR